MKARLTPFRIVSLYAVVGGLWILFSDKAMMAIVKDPEVITRIGIIKGSIFVIATSLLIYFLIRKYSSGLELSIIEEKLRLSEEKFAKVFNRNPDMILLTDSSNGRIIDVNEAFCRRTGYGRDETIGRTTQELKLWLNEIDRDKIISALRKDGKLENIEALMRQKNGNVATGLMSAETIELSGKTYMVGIFRDITDRKRAEEELKKSEEKFRHVFETSNVGKSITLPTGKIMVNKAFCDMLGYDQNELLNKTWQDLTPAEDINLTNDILKPMLRGEKKMVRFEKRYIHKNGTYIWADVSTAIQRENDGTPLYFITTIVDINKRKQVEENLRLSEELFYNAFHVGPVGMTITRIADGKFIDANESFCRMFEFKRDEVIGHTSSELNMWTPEERRKLVKMQIESGGLRNFELVARTKSGRPINLLFSSILIEVRGENCHITTIIDITERKLAEAERQKFVMLADSSSEFIGICDLDMKPLYVNPAGMRMVGLPDMGAACQVKVQDYFFPEDQRFIAEEFFPRVLRDGYGDVEIRLRHFQTGKPIWMFYYLFSVRDPSGTPVGWATVSRDITERKQGEDELKKHRDHLEELVKERTAELEAKIAEIERMNNLFVGRELRLIELKERINELEKEVASKKT